MTIQLQMDFFTDLGKVFRLTVYDADQTVPASKVKSVMQLLCTKNNVIVTPAGRLTGLKAAAYLYKEVTDYAI